MRTTLDIDDKLLEQVMRLSEAKTKKAAVEEALAEFIRVRNIAKLRSMIGTYEIDLTPEELRRMRGCDRGRLPD